MSSLEDRLAERRRKATEDARAVAQPAAAANGQTPAEKPAETPAPANEPEHPAKPARNRQRAETPPEPPPEMDKDERDRWRWQLGATARKAVAAQHRADQAAQAWGRLVAQARVAGVPERMLMAAALEADIDLPATE